MKLIVKLDYQPAVLIDVNEEHIGSLMKSFEGGIRVLPSGYDKKQRWIISHPVEFSMEILKAGIKIVTQEEHDKLKEAEEKAEAEAAKK